MIEIVAKEYFKKCKWLTFISCKLDSVTTFGDRRVKFDFLNRRVVRYGVDSANVLAQIHARHKGSKLSGFYGTVESETYIVTKRKKNWLSEIAGNAVIEITLKDTGKSFTIVFQRYDFDSIHRVENFLQLQLRREDLAYDRSLRVGGTCTPEYQDLCEVLACLLLHHNEDSGSMS